MSEHSGKSSVSSFAMIRTLAGTALLSAIVIVLVDNMTAARIAANKRAALGKAVFSVLQGATTRKTFLVDLDKGLLTPSDEESPLTDCVYAGYDEKGKLVGVAVRATGQGYGGPVVTLFGYSPDKQAIVGFTVLESLETPGLGDRIGKDPDFLANFKELDTRLDKTGTGLEHPIVLVKHGKKTHPWEIDAISGATISSTCVAKMINKRSQEIIPVIQKNLDVLKGKK